MTIFSYLREPLWMLLTFVPVILISMAALLKQSRTNTYSDPRFDDWVISADSKEHKHRFRQLLFIQLAWLAFAVAIAGPRLPEKIHDTQQQYNKDVMVVLDVSLSMSAHDIRPSRLQRAKLELLDLVERLDNTRLGITVYAARPHLLLPPTSDKQLLRYYIQPLRTQLLPTEGSGLFKALRFAIQYLARQQAKKTENQNTKNIPRAIVLITDGEVNLSATDAARSLEHLIAGLKKFNIRLYTLGTGTLQGAPLLSAQSAWLELDNQAIVSKLDETLLMKLANVGSGSYSAVTDDDRDWNRLYNDGIATLSYQTADDKITEHILWQEQYHWFVIAGFIFFLLGLWQPRKSRTNHTSHSSTVALLLAFLLLTITFNVTQPVYAADNDYTIAYEKYRQGDYQAAREGFARVPGYAGRFAEGIMAYQLEQYQYAIPAFIQAALEANTDQQRLNAIFNLANSYFKQKKYAQAKQLYRDVLRYQVDFLPAQVNMEYATALIQKLEDETGTVAQRPGSGPNTADAPENMDISTGKLSLSDSETNGDDPTRTDFTTGLASVAKTELEHSAPASDKIEQDKDTSWTYDIRSLTQLQQLNPRIYTDESILWQRLFEAEEDFEAAQEVPTVLPGVKPW